MNTVLSIAFKIWARTLLINAVLMIVAVPAGIILGGFFPALAAAVIGFLFTLPLLLFITPLVKITMKLPYDSTARIAWLWFYLELLIVVFYMLFFELLNMVVHFRDGAFWLMAFATSMALVIAILWTKKSLKTIIEDKQ